MEDLPVINSIDARVMMNLPLDDNEIAEQYKRASKEFVRKLFLQHITYKFFEDGELPIQTTLPKANQIFKDLFDRYSTKSPYMFLTVNPRPTVSFEELQKCVNKFVSKKTTKEYYYVYEVRKFENNEYLGRHCHILCRYTSLPAKFKASTRNTFKGICDVKNEACLNFKFIPIDILQDKIDYMNGNKKKDKQSGVLITKEWRKENNIPEFFASETPLLTCRGVQNIVD